VSTRGQEADPEPLACPACARRFEVDERFCASCGMPLVYVGSDPVESPRNEAHERVRKIDPRFIEGKLVRVAGGRHQAEAELIQGMLLEEGVPSLLRRAAGFDVPDMLAAGPRDVLVPEAGADVARDVLLQAHMAPQEAAPVTAGDERRHAVRLTGAILGGATLTALVTWGLIQLGG
jgi:hypothetical protein